MSDSKSGGSDGKYRYLTADIGGTNSRLQLHEIIEFGTGDGDGWRENLLCEFVYPSAPASHLNAIILQFLNEACKCKRDTPEWPQSACLAVAGPVKNNQCLITNLAHWNMLDGDQIRKTIGLQHCIIINDFVAIGYGLLALDHSPNSKDLKVIRGAPQIAGAPKACIGAGTGLGETFLTCGSAAGSHYEVWPSEGGHADFAPRTSLEFELLKFLLDRESIDRCSIERVVSGPGIRRLYEFLCKRNPSQVSATVTEALRVAEDKKDDQSAVIAKFALADEPDDLCLQTLNTFISSYGAEAGNMALKTIPYGGMYIAGGIGPKIVPLLMKDNQFWKSMTAKGRMYSILSNVPVYLVTHKQVGLLGAQVICRRWLRSATTVNAAALPSYQSESAPKIPDYHRPVAERQAAADAAAAQAAARSKGSVVPIAIAAPADAVPSVSPSSVASADAESTGVGSWFNTKSLMLATAGAAVGALAVTALAAAGVFKFDSKK